MYKTETGELIIASSPKIEDFFNLKPKAIALFPMP